MHNGIKHHTRWLLPAVLILFILEIFTLPFVLNLTYAGRSEAPNHILTYTPGKLRWDDSTGVDKNGAAVLSLFHAKYGKTVKADNGDRVIAPGTDGFNIVRFKNGADKPVNYTAVLYEIKDNPEIPVKAKLSGHGFSDTDTYTLPDKVKDSQVIRSVSGKLRGGEIQDFDINWLWEYYQNEKRDDTDTRLGDKAAFKKADDVTVGLYIVAEDNNNSNEYIKPAKPKTGDAGVGIYIALTVISGIALILLAVSRRRKKKCGD